MFTYGNVKRVNDLFSIANKQEIDRLDIELCQKCAIRKECDVYNIKQSYPDYIMPVKQCAHFRPFMSFGIIDGLEEESFCTMRVREAWANRLRVGDFVHLYNSSKQETHSVRQVKKIFNGDKKLLLKQHAKNNHAVLNKNVEPVSFLIDILIKSMGKNFYNSSDLISVIYF